MPWAYGLTSGAVALVVNLAIYVAFAYLLPETEADRKRVNELFDLVEERRSHILQPHPQPAE
jgi:SSS family solute:Na+ symporter